MGLQGLPTLGDLFGQDGDKNEGGLDRQGNDQGDGAKSGTSPRRDNKTMAISPSAKERCATGLKISKAFDGGADADGLDGARTRCATPKMRSVKAPAAPRAVDAQGRAVEALREGAQKLAESMRGEAGGSAPARNPGKDKTVKARKASMATPRAPIPSGARWKACEVRSVGAFSRRGAGKARTEGLRRGLGEPARPREEMDYLERLFAAIEPLFGSLWVRGSHQDAGRKRSFSCNRRCLAPSHKPVGWRANLQFAVIARSPAYVIFTCTLTAIINVGRHGYIKQNLHKEGQ